MAHSRAMGTVAWAFVWLAVFCGLLVTGVAVYYETKDWLATANWRRLPGLLGEITRGVWGVVVPAAVFVAVIALIVLLRG